MEREWTERWEELLQQGSEEADVKPEQVDRLMDLFEKGIEGVDAAGVSSERALEMYGALMADVAFVNHAISIAWPRSPAIRSSILKRLQGWVRRLEAAVRKIAVALKQAGRSVSGFSIGVSGPVPSVSIAISFSV